MREGGREGRREGGKEAAGMGGRERGQAGRDWYKRSIERLYTDPK